ncbi:MAG: 2,3-bisphosphoglycerate-independent phosphoglycerate mutase [Clostridiaceae bacterium]|jgi:2,3-bisphosphoglycerate-independent phosphoglycerate mutase|nr:2,3-bisphosphoglycerate-independent phosphoglycerate mutase [Clostridiaceae bacterium]
MKNRQIALIILDGYGISDNINGNAIKKAKTPNIDSLYANWSHSVLSCSGMDVGLPEGQMGNSEVGHTNIGAGRVVYQELTRITKSIDDGDFFTKKALIGAVENCKSNNSALHLIGLVSDGGVHSHNTHLYALLELAKRNNINKVFIHCLLDGRDVPPTSGLDYINQLENEIKKIGVGKIATVMGRYYAMDRDNRWERVQKAYEAMVLGEGVYAQNASEAVASSYEQGINDEFVIPIVIENSACITNNDSVVFFNFRPDRAREITRSIVDENFNNFQRKNGYFPTYYVCFTQYDASMPNVKVAFLPQQLDNTFGEYISKNGLKQLRIAETEKYAHVTFFFNGGIETVYSGEDRVLIPSPKVPTYDLKPEMSAYEVADECIKRIKSGKYDVVILNFANCDMVGHTGNLDATVAAVEAVDDCLGKVTQAVLSQGGIALITADHGNAEQMLSCEGNVQTAHSTNIVPLILAGEKVQLKSSGVLADLAPTMLDLMGLEIPDEMTGTTIICS